VDGANLSAFALDSHYTRIVSGLPGTLSALLGGSLLIAISTAPPPTFAQSNQTSDEQALQPMRKALADYVALRERLHQEVPPLAPNSEARDIATASDALARAIMRARVKARQGDFFDKIASQVITRRLRETITTANLAADLAAIDDEPPRVTTPRLHLRFPDAAQMASMPPSLLRVLPTLPEGLEYRIVGKDLVLRDVGAALILDYIPQAIAMK
jgi:hypothetical protein